MLLISRKKTISGIEVVLIKIQNNYESKQNKKTFLYKSKTVRCHVKYHCIKWEHNHIKKYNKERAIIFLYHSKSNL